ncbi:MAG TPA: type II secretion system F family protein [Xanthobacteraceae bacterium]|nr:type II secretion system F family protein [Xanthobacteraceae bacterium]
MQTYALFFLVTIAIGGAAWVFIYPLLSGERNAKKRVASAARAERMPSNQTRAAQKPRREQIENTLKEIEERQKKAKRMPLAVRISQAGLTWSKRRFMLTSAVLAIGAFLLAIPVGAGLIPALGLAFAAGCGLPLWLLSYLKKRRQARFLENFPDSVDVIVRGIKAGLPLLDSFKLIVADAEEPIRGEFRAIIETQTIGMPLGEACLKLRERMPLAEANFFGIVISVQQRAGGNLSEALGNLSRVLRDRKRMQAKIQAMSMEAKASATIIGALPLAVMALVYFTSPAYIELLWTTSLGRTMLTGCALWMGIGILVMRKMINFDF